MIGKVQELQAMLANAKSARYPLIFIIPGSGQIAGYGVDGGAHFVMVLNAGLYRLAGVGSLGAYMPYGNANDQTEDLLRRQILPRIRKVPIVAGIIPNDPVLPLSNRLKRMKDLGVSGITNWPYVGMFDGNFRQSLDLEGFTTGSEIEMLQVAAQMGFVTFGFAASATEAHAIAKAGIHALILNAGVTHEIQDIHQKGDRIQFHLKKINEMIDAAEATGAEPIFFFFGGSITRPEDTAELYRRTKVHGYGGGSAFERIPVRHLVTNTVKQFCSVSRTSSWPAFGDETAQIVGSSPEILKLVRLIQRVAGYDVSVLIEGESGVGKELVANQLHTLSHRSSQPYITLNCGAIPDTLIESEFFGHEKGAFTGASSRRIGKFELANHGTLFLDEVAELSPKAQVSLLRVIQQKEIFRVGGEKAIPVDVRIISATHQNLKSLVDKKLFRADLYYRLNMIKLLAPSLRTHPQDIPSLVNKFLEELGLQFDRQLLGVTPEWMGRLMTHSWPGNIRELKHVLCRAILLEDGLILKGEDFAPETVPVPENGSVQAGIPLAPLVKENELNTVINAINAAAGNKSRAAKLLGISRKTLYARLKRMEAS
jgi:DNA-binding NtrC family response regulator/predicted TIM-barrel enzyme